MLHHVKCFVFCLLAVALLLLAAYYGMSKSLCSRIDSFSVADQKAMRLDASTCAKYY